MGFLDMFRRNSGLHFPAVAPNGVPVEYDMKAVQQLLGLSLEDLWRSQPHLRTVVGFLARNIAQLGLPSFERVSETDRKRSRDSVSAKLLSAPNETMTRYNLIYALVADRALYDIAYWWVTVDADRPSGWRIDPIPPSWVINSGGGSRYSPAWYDVQADKKKAAQRIPASELIVFPGWNPGHPNSGSSPVEALKAILAEQIHAYIYRQQVWQRAGRVGDVLTRPANSPWSEDARTRFARDWKAKWSGDDGPQAGGTPILEDGMTLQKVRFSAHEEEWIEAAKLALATVAQVYYVNPTMIGQLDNANFSNVREFRKMLYGDTLGPELTDIDTRINSFLLPMIGEKPDVYVEFNIEEKLQGNFEEQAQAMSTAIGRPWMMMNEGRALKNMPAVEGGDDPVIPLNVLLGGQASPQDGVTAGGGGVPILSAEDIKQRVDAAAALIRSGFEPEGALAAVGLDPIKHLGLLPVTVQRPQEPENVDQEAVDDIKAAGVHVKARAPQTHDTKTEQVLRSFFNRQRKAVLPAIGAKAGPGWWDAKRWDKELSDDLYALAVQTSKTVASAVLKSIGFKPDVYDVDRTLKFLRAVADSRAGMINSTTRDQLKAALASDDEAKTPAHVFDIAESDRAVEASAALVTTFSSFGSTEAAKQVAGDAATKTWVVTSTRPRASHSSMSGETVGIDETFSNGMDWPGDPAGGADEVAGCQCDVEINIS